MKRLTLPLLLFLVLCSPEAASAQEVGAWIQISPPGEQFTVQVPASPNVTSQQSSYEQLKVQGHAYTAIGDGVDYVVWSLVNEDYSSHNPPENGAYLDDCADLVWRALLKPYRDQASNLGSLLKVPKYMSSMTYQDELDSRIPGREYALKLGKKPGVTRIFVDGKRIYVLAVLNADTNDAGSRRFLKAFDLPGFQRPTDAELPPLRRSLGQGLGPGKGDYNNGGGQLSATARPTDYNRVFSGTEVTEKPRIRSKPKPNYTESAIKYSVRGKVIIHAVFTRSGEVTNVVVVKGLPHGLTQNVVDAVRKIKFTPASKDGHAVSTRMRLEYYFDSN